MNKNVLKKSYNEILKKFFGYDELKPQQFEIIDKLVNHRMDVCGVLATGYGKSMCYQLPCLITNKIVLVISPLIALMQDQKQSLEKKNIPVCCLNGQTQNKNYIMEEILNSEAKGQMIYTTPEFMVANQDFLKNLAERELLSMICIDEAHCMSIWGHDFRMSYTKLDLIRDIIPEIPILALTGTATPKVRSEICRILKLANPHIVIGTFNRENLYIEVTHKSDDVKNDLRTILYKNLESRIIVYCKTIKETESVRVIIEDLGIKCLVYHAGLQSRNRAEIQKSFTENECKCIIATIAFGMGIDIPDIRVVIHFGCPKNLESYYQEIGRAGRDGKRSECYLLYSGKDFIISRAFLKNISDKKERDYQEDQIRMIEKYVNSAGCRRRMILEHFHDFEELQNLKELKNGCGNCDNCFIDNNSNEISYDYTKEAKQILETIKELKDNHGLIYGTTTILNILMGSNSAKITEIMKNVKNYGSAKKSKYSKDIWKSIIKTLKLNDYIIEKQIRGKFGVVVLEVTKKGDDFIKDKITRITIKIKLPKNTKNDEDNNLSLFLAGASKKLVPMDEPVNEPVNEPVKKPEKPKNIKPKVEFLMDEPVENKPENQPIKKIIPKKRDDIINKMVGLAFTMYKNGTESIDNLAKITGLSTKYLKKAFESCENTNINQHV